MKTAAELFDFEWLKINKPYVAERKKIDIKNTPKINELKGTTV